MSVTKDGALFQHRLLPVTAAMVHYCSHLCGCCRSL